MSIYIQNSSNNRNALLFQKKILRTLQYVSRGTRTSYFMDASSVAIQEKFGNEVEFPVAGKKNRTITR